MVNALSSLGIVSGSSSALLSEKRVFQDLYISGRHPQGKIFEAGRALPQGPNPLQQSATRLLTKRSH
jgi:hypothetical protein